MLDAPDDAVRAAGVQRAVAARDAGRCRTQSGHVNGLGIADAEPVDAILLGPRDAFVRDPGRHAARAALRPSPRHLPLAIHDPDLIRAPAQDDGPVPERQRQAETARVDG